MTTMRLRRLQADYEAVRRLAHLHPRIEVEGVVGNPPEQYVLEIEARSLRERDGRIGIVKKHRVEVTLPLTYPRDPPVSRMLTPVFHPNIAPHSICVGDHWSAGESLANLIQRIGEMLCFQSYNVKSPLNGRAARWVEENEHRLPIDSEEFFLDFSDAPPEESRRVQCANCGSTDGEFTVCAAGHEICPDCTETCPTCGRILCIACGTVRCPECSEVPCANCGAENAGAYVCPVGHALCADCEVVCEKCGAPICLACGGPAEHRCA
jgi:ubiquitin-protein ligase